MMFEATRRRHEHADLHEYTEQIRLAAREIPVLAPDERRLLGDRTVEFLRRTLVPHAKEEEWGLYPEVARVLGDPRSTATMARDHEAIRARIDELAIADPADAARLQELLYGLHALITVHLWKEEVEYLPLLGERQTA